MKSLPSTLAAALAVSSLAAASLALAASAAPATAAKSPAKAAAVAPAASGLPGGIVKVTSVEGITEYRMPSNGLRILLFPDPSKQTATVNITYMVGSRHENYGETGMAHLLEHLMFKGSTNHPHVPDELTAHGCRPNGSTWYDRTNYFETFNASDENIAWALDLEADRMVNSFIAKKDLESEMTVVRNEYEMGENSPAQILEERVWSTAYLWHNYGKSTIGARSDIEQVPIERLQDFYRRWYQPDNAVLAVAGKIDEAKVLALIAQKFGKLPRPTRVMQTLYTEEPVQDGERSVTLRRTGDVQVVTTGYHIAAGSHADFPALEILAYILGDTPSGRLHKTLVESKLASSVNGTAWQFHDPSLMIFSAEVPKDKPLGIVRDSLLAVVESMGKRGVTAEEVERARQAYLKQWDLTMQESERACIGLSEWSGMGDWRLMFLERDRLKAVTPEDVQRVAQTYLKESNRTSGQFIPTDQPDRATIPPTPLIAALVRDYKGGAAVSAGENFDPSPSNIDARTVRASLPSGMKLVMVPKKTRGATVRAQLVVRFGSLETLKGKRIIGGLCNDMLMRGTATRTRQQIQDEMDRLKTRIRVGGDATEADVSIESTRENFPEALKLVADILRNPAFPVSELELVKTENITQRDEARSDPMSKGMETYRRRLSPLPADDPRYMGTPDEDIAAIKAATLDQVKDFHKMFYGGSASVFAIAGDIDAAETQAQLNALFGDWKSATPFVRLPNPYEDIAATNESIETPDKANAMFLAGQRLPLGDKSPDYAPMLLGNFMTGGGFLNSRLGVRIRQKEGLSYGVGSFLQLSSWEQNGIFGSYAIYNPQNAAKLESAFKEEIQRVLKDGFTADEIAQAKSGWLQSQTVSRSNDDELARTLATNEYVGRTMTFQDSLEKQVETLSNDQILAAMRKYLDVVKMTIIKAGDFAGTAKGAAPKQ